MSKYVSKLPTLLQLMLNNINIHMRNESHCAYHKNKHVLSDEHNIDFQVNTKYYA